MALLLTGIVISQAGALQNWVLRNPLPTPQSLTGVAFGNGLFIAAGDFGTVLHSPDGIEWRTAPRLQNSVQSLAFGNGLFVAVDSHGNILTTTTGQRWEHRFSAPTGTWVSLDRTVVFVNGRFFVIGPYPEQPIPTQTSDDGIRWSDLPSIRFPMLVHDLTWGNSTYVGVGPKLPYDPHAPIPGVAWTSLEATTWHSNAVSQADFSAGIAFGNGLFVAGAYSRVYTSGDGTNWMPGSQDLMGLRALRYLNGRFIAVGESLAGSSTDGYTWLAQSFPNPLSLVAVDYGNGAYVAVGLEGEIVSSKDGLTWVRRSVGTRQNIAGLAWGAGQLVAVGAGPQRESGSTIQKSSNGVDWAESFETKDSILTGVEFGAGRFVTVSDRGNGFASTDASTWQPIHVSNTNNISLNFVRYVGDRFFAGGGSNLFVSTDGLSWKLTLLPDHEESGVWWPRAFVTSVAFGNGTFVAVGPVPYTSVDANHWTARHANTDNFLSDVAFGNGIFVATHLDNNQVGDHVYTSRDGITWHKQPVPSTPPFLMLNQVTFGSGWFVAVGNGSLIVVSPDGVHWDVVQQDSSFGWLTRATFAMGSFLVGGQSGTILQSGVLGRFSQAPKFHELARTAAGELVLSISCDPTSVVVLEDSLDLRSWNSAAILTNANGKIDVTITSEQITSPAFFRARAVSE